MSTLPDELRALAGEQPVQPTDRLTSVRARSRRLRRTRAAVVALALLVVAAPTMVLVQQQRDGGSAPRPLARADVTSWPDRSQPGADLSLYDHAVANFTEAGGTGPVQWLYRGILPTADVNDIDIALSVFVGFRDGEQVVVASVNEYPPGGEPRPVDVWTRYEQDASTVTDHVGIYVRNVDSSQAVLAVHNLLFAVTAPGAQSLHWTEEPVAGTSGRAPSSGDIPVGDGVTLTDIGELRGPVTVSLDGGPSSELSISSKPTLSD